ncbi:hypothetical protein SAMN06265365_105240 [Tistlia consotensis]|uniref:Uncharacterized protein n=1 Tax=Tistlia consotensis USBA 355 TaxID=560819 RepID=A0A1Y6BN23_9PROT|nr:hypothetical protein [Tistlia consotensis]SMF12049.1 hypothetical protein SAMN05428998_10558 [Tistlia consotensis USBA 355]SNR51403.1 hypothetical protein SAMN06265365_105240 [Tistlia consotensis]
MADKATCGPFDGIEDLDERDLTDGARVCTGCVPCAICKTPEIEALDERDDDGPRVCYNRTGGSPEPEIEALDAEDLAAGLRACPVMPACWGFCKAPEVEAPDARGD